MIGVAKLSANEDGKQQSIKAAKAMHHVPFFNLVLHESETRLTGRVSLPSVS
jgi:hypothetical protein